MGDEIKKLAADCEALGSIYVEAAVERGRSQARPDRPSEAPWVEKTALRRFLDATHLLIDRGRHTLAAEITDRALREAGRASAEAMKAELDFLRRTA